MKKIPINKILSIIIILVALGTFTYILFRAFLYAPSDEVPLPLAVKDVLLGNTLSSSSSSFNPIKITIPKINVDAKVVEVGISKKGNMATPNNFTDVGWYKYGPMPGSIGSAVIAGHVNNGLALPAVFFNLKNLTKGDDIYLTSSENKSMHFVVIKKEVYDFNSKADAVFADDSGRLLKLITCSGTWLEQYRTHNQRLVVIASLVED
jgi:LPXTG-site transpeptidase (sortase) family protein